MNHVAHSEASKAAKLKEAMLRGRIDDLEITTAKLEAELRRQVSCSDATLIRSARIEGGKSGGASSAPSSSNAYPDPDNHIANEGTFELASGKLRSPPSPFIQKGLKVYTVSTCRLCH